MRRPGPGAGSGRRLVGADLAGEDLRESHLAGADLTGADLRRANLQGLDLRVARLRDARLDGADLRDARVDDGDLRAASLEGALANGSSWVGADLTLAHLGRADFRSADLTRAILTDTNLSRGHFERANLTDASLLGAELAGASFRQAILCGANLREAHLDGADFAASRFAFTVLAASDLSRARGLEDVVHDGPSTVGVDAFLLSRGEIPDRFLAGIGLSTLAIDYLKAIAAAEEGMLVGEVIFLLFHDSERACARRLRAHLRMHRHQAWYWQQLDELVGRHNPARRHRVRFHDRLIVLASAAAGREPAVLEPVERALELERAEGRPIVFAVRIGPAAGTPVDERLADRVLADFGEVDWDDPRDACFHRELDRLLSRLRP